MLFKKKVIPKTDYIQLELEKLKIELDSVYSVFENVTDPDLIDSSIYQLNSLQQRYRYLLRELKNKDIVIH